MKPTPSTPKLLPPQTNSSPTRLLEELTSEEALLRHRLELKVERSLYKAMIGLQSRHDIQLDNSTHPKLIRFWSDEQSIQTAFSEARTALEELRARRLYRSTHHHFDSYYQDRFCCSVVEILPEGQNTSTQQM